MHADERRVVLLLSALLVTFIVTRLILHRFPNLDLNLGRHNVHHLFVGVLLVTLCGVPLVLLNGNGWILDLATVGFGIGLSLALDQWVYLITTDGSNASYLLPISFWGGVVMVGLACALVVAVWLLSLRAM